MERTAQAWARRVVPAGESVVLNPLGWTRSVNGAASDTDVLPPFGHAVAASAAGPTSVHEEGEQTVLERRGLRVHVDMTCGTIDQIYSEHFPDGVLAEPLLDLQMVIGGKTVGFAEVETVESANGICLRRRGPAGEILVAIDVRDDPLCVHVRLTTGQPLERPDPAMHAGLRLPIEPGFAHDRLLTDTPYAVDETRAEQDHVRKYPSGDWMTSEQFFETIRRPFTAWSLVDFDAGDCGLLHVHSGSQAFFRTERGVDNLLSMYDAWDGDAWIGDLDCELWLLPHGRLGHADRWRIAQECRRQPTTVANTERVGRESHVDLPPRLGALDVEPANVIATAFFRESAKAAEHLDRPFGGAISDPHVVRLVEFDGVATDVVLRVPGPCARAARTDMLGGIVHELDPSPCSPPLWAPATSTWNALHLSLRPREIATVMLDLEPGRHQPRNLDEHRQVWATVHRHGDDR